MIDLDKLKATLAAATPEPWRVSKVGLMNDGSLPVSSEYGRIGAANIHRDVKRKDAWQSVCPMRDANATLFAMAPDLAAEVIRLTTERDAAVAANAALMVRVEEARQVIQGIVENDIASGAMPYSDDELAAMARAWLAGKAGA